MGGGGQDKRGGRVEGREGVEKHTKSAPGVKNIKNLQRAARGAISWEITSPGITANTLSRGRRRREGLFVRLNVHLQDLVIINWSVILHSMSHHSSP